MAFLKGHVSGIEGCPKTTSPHTQTHYPWKFLCLTNEALTESSNLQQLTTWCLFLSISSYIVCNMMTMDWLNQPIYFFSDVSILSLPY